MLFDKIQARIGIENRSLHTMKMDRFWINMQRHYKLASAIDKEFKYLKSRGMIGAVPVRAIVDARFGRFNEHVLGIAFKIDLTPKMMTYYYDNLGMQCDPEDLAQRWRNRIDGQHVDGQAIMSAYAETKLFEVTRSLGKWVLGKEVNPNDEQQAIARTAAEPLFKPVKMRIFITMPGYFEYELKRAVERAIGDFKEFFNYKTNPSGYVLNLRDNSVDYVFFDIVINQKTLDNMKDSHALSDGEDIYDLIESTIAYQLNVFKEISHCVKNNEFAITMLSKARPRVQARVGLDNKPFPVKVRFVDWINPSITTSPKHFVEMKSKLCSKATLLGKIESPSPETYYYEWECTLTAEQAREAFHIFNRDEDGLLEIVKDKEEESASIMRNLLSKHGWSYKKFKQVITARISAEKKLFPVTVKFVDWVNPEVVTDPKHFVKLKSTVCSRAVLIGQIESPSIDTLYYEWECTLTDDQASELFGLMCGRDKEMLLKMVKDKEAKCQGFKHDLVAGKGWSYKKFKQVISARVGLDRSPFPVKLTMCEWNDPNHSRSPDEYIKFRRIRYHDSKLIGIVKHKSRNEYYITESMLDRDQALDYTLLREEDSDEDIIHQAKKSTDSNMSNLKRVLSRPDRKYVDLQKEKKVMSSNTSVARVDLEKNGVWHKVINDSVKHWPAQINLTTFGGQTRMNEMGNRIHDSLGVDVDRSWNGGRDTKPHGVVKFKVSGPSALMRAYEIWFNDDMPSAVNDGTARLVSNFIGRINIAVDSPLDMIARGKKVETSYLHPALRRIGEEFRRITGI